MAKSSRNTSRRSRFVSDYGMVFVLLLLCVFFSIVTWDEQQPNGQSGARQFAGELAGQAPPGASILIVARKTQEDVAFANALSDRLSKAGQWKVVGEVKGEPMDARKELERILEHGGQVDLVVTNAATAKWAVFDSFRSKFPQIGKVRILTPTAYHWPNFLKGDNLLNVANQIVVIAIIAVGMTMVIITAGIDLSVGSLIALSAVVTTLLIRDLAGAEKASAFGMFLSCLGGMAVCGLVGAFSGIMVTVFWIPSFIVTLAMMLVASGLAFILAGGQSVYKVPDSFVWLGRGSDLLGVPNAVVLMVLIYIAAHILMTRTTLGRYIYAVGGNIEAARLSGVRVNWVLLFVYTLCGALAGLGGIVMASQLKSGAPTYGLMYELYVIAAVVVGGTSLAGGEGKILGTLIGAFIIAVIQNGMNLTGIESYTQKVVLGLVILGAVLLDMLKKQGWQRIRGKS